MIDYQCKTTPENIATNTSITKNKEAAQVAVFLTGLPKELQEEVFKVTREYRKHP